MASFNDEIKIRVDHINSIAQDLATVNKQINLIEINGPLLRHLSWMHYISQTPDRVSSGCHTDRQYPSDSLSRRKCGPRIRADNGDGEYTFTIDNLKSEEPITAVKNYKSATVGDDVRYQGVPY